MKYFGRARVRFIRFDGREELTGPKMNVIKDVIFEGRLLDQLNASINFIRTQIKERTFLGKDALFVTIPEYPESCWKELIVNAVTHRDYSIVDTDIQIKMFDDKFVVESPGIFAGTVTEKNIRFNHFSRNKAIAAYMKEYEFVKEFGEGVKRIYREMAAANLPQPTFKKRDFMTIATIRNDCIEENVPVNVPVEKSDEDLIIEAIKINNKITMDEMTTIIRKTRKAVMRVLQKSTKIKRVGSDRYGHWEINDDVPNENTADAMQEDRNISKD